MVSQKKKKILLFGNYGGQNWGDEAILSGILFALDKKHFEVTVVSTDPEYTQKHHKVDAVSPPPFGFRSLFKNPFSFFRVLSKTDFVIFGGGGLFQDREKMAPLLWASYIFWCRFYKKKIFFVGNSVGPLSSFLSKKLARYAFSDARYISLRDSSSLKLLSEIGSLNKNSVLTSDTVFLLRKISKPLKSKGTLVLLRSDSNISSRRIQKLYKNFSKPITAIAMDQVDQKYAESLKIPLYSPKDVLDLRKKIAAASLVISSRLHGGILALSSETPFLLFSAAPKVKHFFEDRDLGELVFPEKYNEKKLIEKIKDLKKSSAEWQKRLRKIRLEEQRKAKEILPLLFRR